MVNCLYWIVWTVLTLENIDEKFKILEGDDLFESLSIMQYSRHQTEYSGFTSGIWQ